ncbi:hypothetical protein QBC34DRAFT_438899 [Podospora aff. communis PSN243]|uniref:HTH psq-type domain-containing protein n=1 Tax=Podospora aff. communis PSN243 TaxID=3040156 RepID=A0AAV9GM42_9PEZI|nr:hypothetical protein QBC34DRAFT_438899 [Podospora aff. communis PSN243]
MSSPENNTIEASEPNLSETDRKFLEMAITCLKTPPEIDIQKLAVKMNVKPKTISNRWGELRKKLFANEGAAPATNGIVPQTPRKRKAPAAAGGENAKKTPRSAKGKKASQLVEVTKEENSEEEDDAGVV